MNDNCDIFIAYVAEDAPGDPSSDSYAAKEIADRLAEHDVRAFLSDGTEPARETADALETAKTVIAVASCPEYEDVVRKRLERSRIEKVLRRAEPPQTLIVADEFIPTKLTPLLPDSLPFDFDDLDFVVSFACEPLGLEIDVDYDEDEEDDEKTTAESTGSPLRDFFRRAETNRRASRLQWRMMPFRKKLPIILGIWAAIALAGGILYAVSERTIGQDGLVFRPQKGRTCVLIGAEDGVVPSSLTIPATVNGRTVTAVGGDAFAGCTELTSITVPEGVTTVDLRAFSHCVSLTDVALPDSVTRLGFNAFEGCTSLETIGLPAGLVEINGGLFKDCTSLSAIEFPDGLQAIDTNAFENCSSLTSVTIPAGVRYVGYQAFAGCTSLTEILVSDGNGFLSSADGVLYNGKGTELLCCPAGREGVFAIPDGVTTVSAWAFDGCSSLTGVTVPESVTHVGGSAFLHCTALQSISLPDSVTYLGSGAFEECFALTDVRLPAGLTELGTGMFRLCGSLAEVTLPDGVTSIGFGAFNGCTALQSLDLPDGVTAINGNAFWGCTALQSIRLPAGLTEIGLSAFSCCTALTGITIPESVTEIGSYAFSRCTSLTDVTLLADTATIGESAFEQTPAVVHAPHEAAHYGFNPGGVTWVVE